MDELCLGMCKRSRVYLKVCGEIVIIGSRMGVGRREDLPKFGLIRYFCGRGGSRGAASNVYLDVSVKYITCYRCLVSLTIYIWEGKWNETL